MLNEQDCPNFLEKETSAMNFKGEKQQQQQHFKSSAYAFGGG